jgi:hypothetical protein
MRVQCTFTSEMGSKRTLLGCIALLAYGPLLPRSFAPSPPSLAPLLSHPLPRTLLALLLRTLSPALSPAFSLPPARPPARTQ